MDVILLEDIGGDKTDDKTNKRKRYSESAQLTKIESDVASLLLIYVTVCSVLTVAIVAAIRRGGIDQILMILFYAGHLSLIYRAQNEIV